MVCFLRDITLLTRMVLVPADRKKPSPPPAPVCKIIPDYSSTEGELRTAIFAADTKLAAKILCREETFGLGEGLRYLPEQQCAIVRTVNPRRDPDIVAIQVRNLNLCYINNVLGHCIEC